MIKKVHKFFWDYEKEENWINSMAANGYMLKAVCWGTYFFEKSEKGEYFYRIQLLDKMPSNPESLAYIEFLEEAEVELVSTYLKWAYFRKKSEDGNFELLSDVNSKLKHYFKVFLMFFVIWALNLFSFILNLLVGIFTSINSKYYSTYYIDNKVVKQISKNGPLGINFYLSFLNLVIVICLGIVVFRLLRRIINLKKQQKIIE